MREIKFRAWDKVNKKMCSSIGTGRTTYGGNLCLEITKCRPDVDSLDNKATAPFNYELMQFTGVTDRNGVEVWEGDIIGYKDEVALREIAWDNRRGGWNAYDKEGNCFDGISWITVTTNRQVLGNIYENPELLNNIPYELIK